MLVNIKLVYYRMTAPTEIYTAFSKNLHIQQIFSVLILREGDVIANKSLVDFITC